MFVRRDLSVTQQIVQTAHAVDEIGKRYQSGDENYMVLIDVKNEQLLVGVSESLREKDIEHELFFEPDINSYTAIATRPLIGDERMSLKGYRLMR
jgi:flagellar biogenesis protein FliO